MQVPPEKPVFWLPKEDTGAIALAETPAFLSASAEPQPTIEASATVTADGETYLLCNLGGGQQIQLVHAADGSPDRPLGAFVPLGLDGFDRLEAIGRLLAGLHGRTIPLDARLTLQQRARSQRMLQAFDGYRAGATQQEIAQVIFRLGPLDRHGWQASPERHVIKSLLRDARAMIAGGYRMLLRHSRNR